ncbi:hypothetical protein Deipe_2231 [Deinococcus peraridilitoris DSM 19664]|uniref:Knr4/Smi1-like domain-containing protein n=2 Tax=Deinococcus TaxID=1298 RepID=L0A1L1_DEIPD|nr:hypothetical protein Deipe_2231 [Deinococcus peraridilitoris DSM 19664]
MHRDTALNKRPANTDTTRSECPHSHLHNLILLLLPSSMPIVLPESVERQLTSDNYQRDNPSCVTAALNDLGVRPSTAFVEFYSRFTGAVGSDTVHFELLDLCENGEDNILHLTQAAREHIGLAHRFLMLAPYGDGGFLILDTESDQVFYVDAEGGTDDVANGVVEPEATSFHEFLASYFAGPVDTPSVA